MRMRSERVWIKMAFVTRRLFSSTAVLRNLKPSLATPAPLSKEAVLSTPELRSLQAKAAGSWKELSKEEVVQCKKLFTRSLNVDVVRV